MLITRITRITRITTLHTFTESEETNMPDPELVLSIHGARVRFTAGEGWSANDAMMARHLNTVAGEWAVENGHAPTAADAEAIAREEYGAAVQAWREPETATVEKAASEGRPLTSVPSRRESHPA